MLMVTVSSILHESTGMNMTSRASLSGSMVVRMVAGSMVALAVGVGSPAFGQALPVPVFSTFADQANRAIPNSGGQVFFALDAVRVSSSGQWWAVFGDRVFPTVPPATPGQDVARDSVYVAGAATATSVTGGLILGERDGFPAGTAGVLATELNGTPTALGPIAINNNGQVAIASLNVINGTTSHPNNRTIWRGQVSASGAVSNAAIVIREGSPQPGVPFISWLTGQDLFVDGIADNGDVLFRSYRMYVAGPPVAAGTKRTLMRGGTVLGETLDGARQAPFADVAMTNSPGVYSINAPFDPAGGSGAGPMTSGDGQFWAAVGQIGNQQNYFAVNGVLQMLNGTFLNEDPDFAVVDTSIFRLASNGRWAVRGATTARGFVRTGVGVGTGLGGGSMLTESGKECVPCFGLSWRARQAIDPETNLLTTSLVYGNVAINASGRWVVSGLNNSTSASNNFVMVADGRSVLLREGQTLDLNGDGVANDDAVLLGLPNNTVQLGDDNVVWFIAEVRRPLQSAGLTNPDGSPRFIDGRVLFRMALPPVACGSSDVAGPNQSIGADGELTADDIIVFLGAYFADGACADVAGANQTPTPDGQLTADDIIVFLGRYFGGC
jgi:hypothetical protein